ncbi:MAG TPA: tetratricopeptide repeat protein, partial [Acetobacteraceae bacterium]|nr:tetratricopeptide repeat protein [Acetobacteraceae bacterium]
MATMELRAGTGCVAPAGAILGHARPNRVAEAHAVARMQAGLALCAGGDAASGLIELRVAEALAPQLPLVQCGLALAWQALGDPVAALAACARAMALGAADATTLRMIGTIELQCGEPERAAATLFAAFRGCPEDARIAQALGLALHRSGQPESARALLRAAVTAMPGQAAPLADLAAVLLDQGALAEAADALEQALALRPDDPGAWRNLGNARLGLDQIAAAEAAYRAALALAPDDADTLANLAAALNRGLCFEAAIETCRQALALRPDCVPALINLGAALIELERYEAAVACLGEAVARAPANLDALSNLGVALCRAGRPAESLPVYERAIAAGAGAEIHSNYAVALLTAGRFRAGWQAFESRWGTHSCPHHGIATPLWRGEALQGRTVLLHAEGGFGDTIQFVRFAPLVAACGGKVLLRVQPALARLLRDTPGVEAVLPEGATLPDFDLQRPLMSLPVLFDTTEATIPPPPAWLAPPAAESARWREALGPADGRLRVGLVWAGAPRLAVREAFLNNRRRSMPLAALAPLFDLAGIAFYSLQKGEAAEAEAADFPSVLDTGPIAATMDFRDTAGLISALDLVIGVDTAVVHLAASLGKPVWMLNRFDTCWRWMTEREDTPWYPSMRLFRQPAPGAWAPVVERVVRELEKGRPGLRPGPAGALRPQTP